MHWLNWLIVVGWLSYVVTHGLRRSRGTKEMEGYFLANRSLPWWAVGLSVMATQLSAVTMIGTTGQGATDGMRFVQFYFGLPVAMVILSIAFIPRFYRLRVLTAYEYLEARFDRKTRQPIENGEGRIFSNNAQGAKTWDGFVYGPEVGTYHAKLNFVVAGQWAVAIQFRRDSLRPLERIDWMQDVYDERPSKTP